MKTLQAVKLVIALSCLVFLAVSCSMSYSFTGASIPPQVTSIRIEQFPNNALLVNPTLSLEFTDQLRAKFQSQTNLNIVSQGGDLIIEGEITDYSARPAAIQSDDRAALNRLTVTVKVTFVNNFDDSQSFNNQTFSRYVDYPSNVDLSTISDNYVLEVVEYLVDDIFNKTVVNW
jgi:hypothetical protein